MEAKEQDKDGEALNKNKETLIFKLKNVFKANRDQKNSKVFKIKMKISKIDHKDSLDQNILYRKKITLEKTNLTKIK